MNRVGLLAYGAFCYAVFVLSLLWGVVFFGNLFIARTIDAAAKLPMGQAMLVNLLLLIGFSLQHSGMARPRFKAWLTKKIPAVTERSTYVLSSSLAFITLMALWQPIGGIVWFMSNPLARQLLLLVYLSGWVLMLWATFLIDHLQLFGLRQVWCAYRQEAPCREPAFQTPSAYKYLRHPVYAGWLVILWASPIMTISHFVLAVGLTLYVFFGIALEERELEKRLPYYEQYRRKVPMLLPSWRKRLTPDPEN